MHLKIYSMLTEENFTEKGNANVVMIMLVVLTIATIIFFIINY